MNQPESRKRGRPKKPCDQLSSVSKRKKALKIRSELSTNELAFATEKSFKSDGFLDASKVISNLVESPEIATEYLQCYRKQMITKKYIADEALALMIDMRLSSINYILMREGSKTRNNTLYPPYHHVAASK